MDVKPMCPYCGAPMVYDLMAFKCENCFSSSPTKYCMDMHENLSAFLKGRDYFNNYCKKHAKDAALRRPLQKPLTEEELHALIDAGEDVAIYCEAKNDPHAYATILYAGQVVSMNGDKINACDLVYFHYGKTWRAWAQRPTDEERAAAPWEGDGDADL